jgi:hypothetical protein
MEDQQQDWLDERLAQLPYIADGGFTERVIKHLPPPALADRRRLRSWILAGASCCALAVGVVLAMIDFPASSQELTPGAIHFPITDVAVYFSNLIRQPMVLYSSLGTIMLSSLSVLPFLRRWV